VNLGYTLAPDDPMVAVEVSKRSLDYAIRVGNVWGIRYLLGNAVDSAIEIGDWDWALETTDEHAQLFTEPFERLWFGTFRNVIGAYRGEDVEAEARRLYEESLAFDDHQFQGMGRYGLIIVKLLQGDVPTLIELVEEDIRTLIGGLDGPVHGARAAIWKGDADLARHMIDGFSHAPPGRRNETLRTVMEAGVAALEGRRAEARALYTDAQRTFRELQLPLWLAFTDLDILITGSLEPDERQRAADEAREIFTRLRADALLQRLDAALEVDAARHPAPPAAAQPAEAPLGRGSSA
jgi:hypothetical protein